MLEETILNRFGPPPYILQNVSISKNVDLFWKMTSEGQHSIVFTGSSTVLEGISPHIFDNTIQSITGQQVVSANVSQTGATTAISKDVISSLLFPAGARFVVY